MFEEHGWPTAVIGTLGGARTTPEAPDLQRALAQARDAGRCAVALEVTSHALVQHRLDGYRHDVAVFTNLSQDHLDYHGTMEAYFAAKAQLVHARARRAGAWSTPTTPTAGGCSRRRPSRRRAFSLADADELQVGLEESRFRLDGDPVRVRPGGEINVRNALAAAAAARALGVPGADDRRRTLGGRRPAGRLEVVPNQLGAIVVVDYAHTPAGLEEVLARRPLRGRDPVAEG